jgi:DNA helicase II / ATP-dependent DNA helicase PcrA
MPYDHDDAPRGWQSGPPGCGLGKTHFVQRQVGVAAEKFGKTSVMLASLTRAAAVELGQRVDGLHPSQVGTLHSHAWRALDRPRIAEGRDGIKDWNEWASGRGASSLTLNDRSALDPENAPLEGTPVASDGERLLAEVGVLRARMTPVELWRPRHQRFWTLWKEWKDERGWLDFSELIERAITDVPHAPGMPRVMFLDEAQDMSRLEMSLALAWGRSCEQLVVVGDPYQNLYEWRGSEPEVFFGIEAASERVLSQSYRVPRAVHAYSVKWGEQLVPEGKEFPAYEPRDADGEVLKSDVRWRDPETLMKLIEDDLEDFPESDHPTVMVLASCAYMIDPICAVLKQAGLPFYNPYRATHGGWNPMRGASRMLRFLSADPETYGDQARMWTWEDVGQWIEPMKAQGVLARGAKSRVEAAVAARKRFGDDTPLTIDEVTSLVDPEHLQRLVTIDPEWWLENLLASRERQFRYPAEVMRRRGRKALLDKPRICVGTIHSVKGGQADSVYVFPDLSRQGYWNGWDNPATRASTIRAFYVAFTRSRDRLTLCEPSAPEYVPLPTSDLALRRPRSR